VALKSHTGEYIRMKLLHLQANLLMILNVKSLYFIPVVVPYVPQTQKPCSPQLEA